MKNLNRILKNICVWSLALSMTACDFLDTEPFDFSSPETFYKNETECTQALAGVYFALVGEETYGNYYSLMISNTDDLSYFTNPNAKPIANHIAVCNSHDENNANLFKTWTLFYDGINNANVLLDNIDKAEISDEKVKNHIKGEAKFLRAYYHFLLAQTFYEVPVRKVTVNKIEDSSLEATPHKDALDWIIAEMDESLRLMEGDANFTTPSRVKSTTVAGILARVCLWAAGEPAGGRTEFYAKAAEYAGKVVADGRHKLYKGDIYYIWQCMAGDKYETTYNESMWEAEFIGTRLDGNQTYGRIGNEIGNKQANGPLGFGQGFYGSTLILWDLFEEGDLRRDLSIAPYTLDAKGVQKPFGEKKIVDRFCGKFRREWETTSGDKQKNYTPDNFPILRYADVLLMWSEGLLESGASISDALKGINEVRQRAGVAKLPEDITKDNLRQAIRDERARELCFEALRKYDLIRWGIYVKTITEDLKAARQDSRWTDTPNTTGAIDQFIMNTKEKHQFLPIPSQELSVNTKLKQNKFWE